MMKTKLLNFFFFFFFFILKKKIEKKEEHVTGVWGYEGCELKGTE